MPSYPYPRPSVTCDAVVFTMRADGLAVLLIKRKSEPFKGKWALPGGFVDENESLERAAARELAEETGLTGTRLEQLGAFGDPGRDPRGHTITVAWLTFLVAEAAITAGDDATEAQWHAFKSLDLAGARPAKKKGKKARGIPLAFDHAKILDRAYGRLCEILDNPTRPRGFDFFPSRFTIAQMHHFYEVVLGRAIPARGFRQRLLGLVEPATKRPAQKPAAQLYRWTTS